MNGDRGRPEPEWPIREGPKYVQLERVVERPAGGARKRGINPLFLALGGVLLLLLLLWLFSGNRSADQDKLIGNEASDSKAAADPEKLCASSRTYDLIKRELFRRAAQVRGSDQAAFDRLSAHAVLRMENPVMESEDEDSRAANCSGSLSLDLPPGVAVVGGRRTLAADIDYTLQPAADGTGNVVLLRNADAIVAPLATLARVAQPSQQQPIPPAEPSLVEPQQPAPAAPDQAPEPRQAEPAEPAAPAVRPMGARPSFNCRNARTRGEVAVCRDAGLAQLDRQMSGQFFRALDRADPAQRTALQRTRSRFLRYRDSCPTNGCIADAYRGRMREIRDIMGGR